MNNTHVNPVFGYAINRLLKPKVKTVSCSDCLTRYYCTGSFSPGCHKKDPKVNLEAIRPIDRGRFPVRHETPPFTGLDAVDMNEEEAEAEDKS